MRELSPWAVRSNGREAHRQRYAGYMRSPAWYRRRYQWAEEEAGLLPAGGTIVCLGCGKPWKLKQDDLHHITYDRLGAEEHEDLWPLCRGCHTLIHDLLASTKTWRKLPRMQANHVALEYVRDEREGKLSSPLPRGSSALRDYL